MFLRLCVRAPRTISSSCTTAAGGHVGGRRFGRFGPARFLSLGHDSL
jgi:hypothetical protein